MFSIMLLSLIPILSAQSWQDRVRPLIGGIQIQNGNTGGIFSLGFIVYYEYVEMGITWRCYGFVTVSHAVDLGDNIYQNVVGSNNYVGYVERDLPFPRENSDSAFIHTETVQKGTAPSKVAPQVLIDPNCKHNVHGYKSMSQMQRGEYICKVGRTTGRTDGYIKEFLHNSYYGWQVLTTCSVETGDSGGTFYRIFITSPDRPTYLYIYSIVQGKVSASHDPDIKSAFSPTDKIIADLNVAVYTIYSGY
ncbi:MAG: hypothetical protein QXR05_05230 [Candidatus Methanomethylicia archaeon]